jgi:outer membrane receptor protein involved in Fe transport
MLLAGINPTWTNGGFYLLPDIVNETDLIKDKLILSSGWISYFDQNTYANIIKENPFVSHYDLPLNTRVEEKYTGIKGTINSHFTYNTKFAFLNYSDRPLFVNDSVYGNTFYTVSEESMKAYQLHAEIGYLDEEKFQLKLSGDWYNYFKQTTYKKPWGLRPFAANLSGQYIFGRKLLLSADLYALSGSFYPDASGKSHKTKGVFDINAGANYQINDQFNVWLNANNLLNSHYERWNNYPSLGLNILGGIMIKF